MGDQMADRVGDESAGRYRIDCADCTMAHTEACDDCVVTFLCGREPHEAVVIDADEARALRLLAGAGLTPGLRHRRRRRGSGAGTAVPDATMVQWGGRR